MDYKLIKVTSYYRDYLQQYYLKNKDITSQSYDAQFKHLMNDAFSWSDNYSRNFAKLGIESYEIIGNAEPLQNAWAKEHGINKRGRELVLAQIQSLQPDIVFIQDTISYNGLWIKMLREKVPSIRKIIGHLCSPFDKSQLDLLKNFDFMISCAKYFVDKFTEAGIKTYQINHAFDPSILEKIRINKPQQQESDLLFLGSLIASSDMHDIRTSIIEKLLQSDLNLEIYSKLSRDSFLMLLSKQAAYVLTKFLMKIGLKETVGAMPLLKKFALISEFPRNTSYSRKLIESAKGALFGIEMFELLANANTVLNIHGGVGGAKFAANMRLFEVTGVGSCLVTDWKENLDEFFIPDEELVTFKTVDECIEKVKWLRDHPSERDKIARAGQRRTLKDHTYETRVKQLDTLIREELERI